MKHQHTARTYLVKTIEVGSKVIRTHVPDDEPATVVGFRIVQFIEEDTGYLEGANVLVRLDTGGSWPQEMLRLVEG